MYLEIFLEDFAVFRVFLGISRDFAEKPEFRGSGTARNIRSPAQLNQNVLVFFLVSSHQFCPERENPIKFLVYF